MTRRPDLRPAARLDRRVLVLLVAAVVGVAAGVVTALYAPGRSGDPMVGPFDINDPLRLGVPLVSLPSCSGDTVLVLGSGDSASALSAAVNTAGGEESEVRYLRTDESCEAPWAPDADEVPAYVAYQGPFDDESDPCTTRMGADHVRDQVVTLDEGAAEPVNCVCVLPSTDAPVLEPPGRATPAADPETFSWVLGLQEMLTRLAEADGGPGPGRGDPAAAQPTGAYDVATVRRVRDLQAAQAVPVTGTVDATTWAALQDAVCGDYDS